MKMLYAFALLALTAFSLAKNLTPTAEGADDANPVVAQVTCANVLLAIASIKSGDVKSLAKCLCDGNVWGAGMSGNDASYHLGDTSFDVEKIYMNDHVSQIYMRRVLRRELRVLEDGLRERPRLRLRRCALGGQCGSARSVL